MRIVGDVINQLWNLPEIMWQAFSRPQDLSPETRRAIAVAIVSLAGMAFLYSRYQERLHAYSKSRSLELDGDDDKRQYSIQQTGQQTVSTAALGQMGMVSSEASGQSVVEQKQAPQFTEAPSDGRGKTREKVEVRNVLQVTPEQIDAMNHREFTPDEVEKRLKRSFQRAQEDNDKVRPIPLRGMSWEKFPNRMDTFEPGKGEFRKIPKSALEIQSLQGCDVPKHRPPVGTAQMQGLRPGMEDRIFIGDLSFLLKNGETLPVSYFSLFDGHGGSQCAEFFASKIQSYAESALENVDFDEGINERVGIVNALTKLFIPMTEEYLNTEDPYSKSTAIVVFKIRNRLYVANAGDSRAIIIGGKHTFALSKDHRPEDCEKAIRARGGWVGREKGQASVTAGPWWEAERKEYRGASMARAVGYPKIGTGINPRAEVITYNLEESDEPQFLVICCDGVWDVLSTNQGGEMVRQHRDKSPADIAEIIIKQAYCHNSFDNLTALVIPLNKTPKALRHDADWELVASTDLVPAQANA